MYNVDRGKGEICNRVQLLLHILCMVIIIFNYKLFIIYFYSLTAKKLKKKR